MRASSATNAQPLAWTAASVPCPARPSLLGVCKIHAEREQTVIAVDCKRHSFPYELITVGAHRFSDMVTCAPLPSAFLHRLELKYGQLSNIRPAPDAHASLY